jgi:hypothetical protein
LPGRSRFRQADHQARSMHGCKDWAANVASAPYGERLQIRVAYLGMVLAVGGKIVVDPELLQVLQESGLFRRVEATKHELDRGSIMREECSGSGGACLQFPGNGHNAGLDGIEASLHPLANRCFLSPEERRYRAWRGRGKISAANGSHLPDKTRLGPASGTPMVLAISPKLPAIQAARIASFIWSRSWLFTVIS